MVTEKRTTKRIGMRLTCIAVAAAMLTIPGMEPANAQQRRTLLEQWLFPQPVPRRDRRIYRNERGDFFIYEDRRRNLKPRGKLKPRPKPQVQRRAVQPIKKVRGPRYYTYEPEALKAIALAGLLSARAEAENNQSQPSETAKKIDDAWLADIVADIDPKTTGSLEERPGFDEAALVGWTLKAEAGIAKALEAHYSADPAYLWIGKDGRPNQQARAVMRVLEDAAAEGLDPQDYAFEMEFSYNAAGEIAALGATEPEGGLPVESEIEIRELGEIEEAEGGRIEAVLRKTAAVSDEWTAAEAAHFELALSASALRYAADVENGVINPNKISGYHDFPAYKRDYPALIKTLAASADPARALADMHPGGGRYQALKRALADLRGQENKLPYQPIAADTFFRPGQKHAELPKVLRAIAVRGSDELRETHREVFAAYDDSDLYSQDLVPIIRDFQRENGLGVDGIVGRNTLAKLAIESPATKMAKIRLAMERLRWHPDNLGQTHVFINQPAYNASYVVNGKAQLSMKAIVGKPSNQTSFFHDTIERVEFNPYWNVPRSILVNEMLANIRANPGYLPARNYEVVAHGGSKLSPYGVDWYSPSAIKKVYVRQRPGSGNALGELKILFPNKHSIYMHDTPQRKLFGRGARALSHGCIRLHQPREMAAAVLGTDVEAIGSYIADGRNKGVKVENQIPVYVAYFTAWPDDQGVVRYYTDVYGRDKALTKAFDAVEKTRRSAVATTS